MDGLIQARLAVEHDPLSSYAQTILSILASQAGFNEEAVAAGMRGVEFDKESFSAWYFMGYSNHSAGNISSAIQAYKQAIDIS